jgi:hypothetical protein
MTEGALSPAESAASGQASFRLTQALLVTLLVAFALGALAFWPKRAFGPPPRPALGAPIVFDEFVNSPNPAPAVEPAAH